MKVAEEAYNRLYPHQALPYNIQLKYSDKFKSYNGNVRLYNNTLYFGLSKKWKTVDAEIVIGLLQSLLLKILKDKKTTMNIDLYNHFMKNIHVAIPKTKNNIILEESFNKINEKYFNGLIERPNLVFGQESFRKLGSYEYGTDTITISKIFEGYPEFIDYIMYHELLHKKHKFHHKNNRSRYHTKEFRTQEHQFENAKEMEKKLNDFLRQKVRKRFLKNFFNF